MDISNWINYHTKCTPKKTALRFENQEISYSRFEQRIANIAGGLETREIGLGDRVCYLGGNSPELLMVFFACARIGAIFVPLNARMTVTQHQYYLSHSEPKCLLAESVFAEHAKKCIDPTLGIKLIVFDVCSPTTASDRLLDTVLVGGSPMNVNTELPLDVPLLIAYTSGSTGQPKGAVLTQETLFYGAINATQVADLTTEDHVLTNLPMFHVGGLTVQTLPVLYVGGTVTIHRDFDAGKTLQEIETGKITFYLPLPKISRALVNHDDWPNADLSSLRLIQTGSTIVPLSVLTPWNNRGIPAQQIYGLTEALPPAIAVPLNESVRMAGSMGKPSMYCRVRIVDNNMDNVAAGERGEILLKGPCLFNEYWRNESANCRAFVNGWFRTGDIGHANSDGYLYMDDRLKNIIIVGSSNIYPADLEHILSECEDIAEAAVVGRADPDLGEVPVACVQLKTGRTMTKSQVNRLFENRLAEYQFPRDVVFVNSFPRTSLGKIQRNEIQV
jgi:fatty-acyl-CoA synthase